MMTVHGSYCIAGWNNVWQIASKRCNWCVVCWLALELATLSLWGYTHARWNFCCHAIHRGIKMQHVRILCLWFSGNNSTVCYYAQMAQLCILSWKMRIFSRALFCRLACKIVCTIAYFECVKLYPHILTVPYSAKSMDLILVVAMNPPIWQI